MDIGTLIGCLLGCALIILAVVLGSPDSWIPFFNAPALLIVFGGTAAAVMTAFPLNVFLKTSAYIRKSFSQSGMNIQETAENLISLAESARREGLLALESRLEHLGDRFLAKSMQLAVDGLSPQNVETIVRANIEAVNARHQCGRNVILNYAKYTPAFGMIGTLIGLVLMLTRLDAETVGPGMAVAVLTTLYGTLASNLFFLPIAEKLKQLNEAELKIREMTLRGVLGIQMGEHPQIIKMKLQTFFAGGWAEQFVEEAEKTASAVIPAEQPENIAA
ncbi:MAG: MotA/TolQ/ExbB proton channel family protein [Planctomycetaceae bacterium]|jgi:chemotaxis protein MotA|nr:MotA/TolQ/ExbB proton channel family protein [Planctomycetaceae bacterium]